MPKPTPPLSILYLRCLDAAPTAPYDEVVMLSILYLRCVTGTRLMNALGVGWAFNSLFEMQTPEPRPLRDAGYESAFNSLFEMRSTS